MKRGMKLILYFGMFLIFSMNIVSAIDITANAIESFAVSISVEGRPSLMIISPESSIYFINNLSFEYVEYGSDNLFYSIDGGPNSSIINDSIYFSEGNHSIILYANNSYGLSFSQVNFSVNSGFIEIIYGEFTGLNRGGSTDFYSYSYSELHNLENVTLEDTRYGRIRFLQPINVVDPSNIKDGAVNINKYVRIANKHISLDPEGLPGFDKPAELTFYSLTLTDPLILRDGLPCHENICSASNYENGTLYFNVTNFSTYTIVESSDYYRSGEESYKSSSKGGGGYFVVPSEEIPVPAPEMCEEDWICSIWGECRSTLQKRECYDLNQCGTFENKPLTEKVCYLPEMPKSVGYSILAVLALIIITSAAIIYGILVASWKKKNASNLNKIIKKAYYHLDKMEKQEAREQYRILSRELENSKYKLYKRDFEKIHEKGMILYKEIKNN